MIVADSSKEKELNQDQDQELDQEQDQEEVTQHQIAF